MLKRLMYSADTLYDKLIASLASLGGNFSHDYSVKYFGGLFPPQVGRLCQSVSLSEMRMSFSNRSPYFTLQLPKLAKVAKWSFFPKSLSYLNPACMVEVDGNRTE